MQLDREKFLACAAMLSLTASACGGASAAAKPPPRTAQPVQGDDADVYADLDKDPMAPPRIAGPSASVEVGVGYVAPSLEAGGYSDSGPCYEGYCPPPMIE